MSESVSLIGIVIDKQFNKEATAFNLEVEVSPIQTVMYYDWLPTKDCNLTIGSRVEIVVEPQADGSVIGSISEYNA